MAVTHLKPEHLGELLVTSLLNRLAQQKQLAEVPCYSLSGDSAISLERLMSGYGFSGSLSFHDNVRLSPLELHDATYEFDGLSRIDCLAKVTNKGIPIEIKLGITRMTGKEFGNRFFKAAGWSRHAPPKIKGNMIAILDGRFSQEAFSEATLRAIVGGKDRIDIDPDWLILVRREVWEKWNTSSPDFQRNCRIMVFEDLVKAVGGPIPFDQIVKTLVGDEFSEPWGLA